jgi:hypothetical protein
LACEARGTVVDRQSAAINKTLQSCCKRYGFVLAVVVLCFMGVILQRCFEQAAQRQNQKKILSK